MFQNDDYVIYEEKQSHTNDNKNIKENIPYAIASWHKIILHWQPWCPMHPSI